MGMLSPCYSSDISVAWKIYLGMWAPSLSKGTLC